MTPAQRKARLRGAARIAREGLDETTRTAAARALADALWPLLRARGSEVIGVYLARPVELSLDPLIETLLAANFTLCAPRVDVAARVMSFFRLPSLNAVRPGLWGVREPTDGEPLVPSVVLVPGLAFDPQGRRLGSGGGWYDRALSPAMTAIGVCFDVQIVPHVPTEAHDRRMNFVFSEARVCGPLA